MKEIWKDINGYEGIYQISFGNIKRIKKRRVRKNSRFIKTTKIKMW